MKNSNKFLKTFYYTGISTFNILNNEKQSMCLDISIYRKICKWHSNHIELGTQLVIKEEPLRPF